MVLGIKRSGCTKCANSFRSRNLTQKVPDYLNKLISTKPYGAEYQWLERYGGDNKQKLSIRHLTCGTTFSMRPNDFQQGYQCSSCYRSPGQYTYASFSESSPLYDTDGYLYVLWLSGHGESFVKLGITRKTVEKRVGEIRRESGYDVEILFREKMKLRYASEIEEKIKRALKSSAYLPLNVFAGRTECFDQVCLDRIEEIIDKCVAVNKLL